MLKLPEHAVDLVRLGAHIFKEEKLALGLWLIGSAQQRDENRQASTIEDAAGTAWMQGAEESLATNDSTVALKPIYELLGPTGILERFRTKGYVVEGP